VQVERKLDEDIVVTGQRPTYRTEVVQVGAFRNQSIMDTPASIAVMPRALLDAQGATGLEEALRNTPGVTQQATSPTTSNNFVARGVLMNARTITGSTARSRSSTSAPPPSRTSSAWSCSRVFRRCITAFPRHRASSIW
jgi:outer membrane receptor for monomeric catechols